jgi:hypothetical protein
MRRLAAGCTHPATQSSHRTMGCSTPVSPWCWQQAAKQSAAAARFTMRRLAAWRAGPSHSGSGRPSHRGSPAQSQCAAGAPGRRSCPCRGWCGCAPAAAPASECEPCHNAHLRGGHTLLRRYEELRFMCTMQRSSCYSGVAPLPSGARRTFCCARSFVSCSMWVQLRPDWPWLCTMG